MAIAMPFCWKLPSTIRESGSWATNGRSESRESAKASALPERSIAIASSTEVAAEIEVFFSERPAADRSGVGDADNADIRSVDLRDRLDARSAGQIGRPKIHALLTLFVHRHKGNIDRAGFGSVGHQSRVRRDHELHWDAQLPAELNGKIDGDAARLAVRLLHNEEGRRGRCEDDADAELASGN
jgi:hypothetical protein